MKQLIKRMLAPIFYVTASRKSGMKSELRFWEKWIRTKGSEWPEDFRRRLDPRAAVTGYHLKVLERISADTVTVLDVGAGPLTTIGKVHQGKILLISACDPLADEYRSLLRQYSLEPPVVTEKCEGETLREKYSPDSFDWVNAQNCVDHATDPVQVIGEMLRVAKVGGFISLCHEVNEATLEAYRGLHQWNFHAVNGDFIISGKYGYRRNMTQELRNEVDLTTWVDDENWIHVIGEKKSSASRGSPHESVSSEGD